MYLPLLGALATGGNTLTLVEGTTIVTISSFEQTGLIHYMAPFTGGFSCQIPKGTELEVITAPSKEKGGFYVRPVHYQEFEISYVPVKDRESLKYDGYSFVFNISQLGSHFEVKGG
jgi:hypothetical protein